MNLKLWAIGICLLTGIFGNTTVQAQRYWRGRADNNVWQTGGSPANWAGSPTAATPSWTTFSAGESVIFGEGAARLTVQVVGEVAPANLTIQPGYSFVFDQGTNGSILASGAVNINGALTLNGTSTTPLFSATSTNGIVVNPGGSLILGTGTNRIGDNTALTLSGGSLNATGSETIGALTLTSNSSIFFSGTGTNLIFSSLNLGSSTLNIYNWDPADRFQITALAGSGGTLFNQIRFYSGTTEASFLDIGISDNAGFITPVPEPATIIGALGVVGLIGYRERRRIFSLLKRNQSEEALTTA